MKKIFLYIIFILLFYTTNSFGNSYVPMKIICGDTDYSDFQNSNIDENLVQNLLPNEFIITLDKTKPEIALFISGKVYKYKRTSTKLIGSNFSNYGYRGGIFIMYFNHGHFGGYKNIKSRFTLSLGGKRRQFEWSIGLKNHFFVEGHAKGFCNIKNFDEYASRKIKYGEKKYIKPEIFEYKTKKVADLSKKKKEEEVNNTKPSISSSELKKEKTKRLEEERKRKALEQRIAELEKKNKELQKSKQEQPPKSRGGSGSGFFISKLGHIITNEHVVKKCNKITVGDNIDRQVPARLIQLDRKNDLALLRTTTLDLASSETKSLIKKLSTQKLGIEIVPLATAGLMRSDDVELGEQIVVAGFPYGDIFSKDIKVTFGNVNSTKGVGDDSSQFQIQAPVQIGNSGGPIYDKYGNIVGVVVAQLDKLKMAKTIGSLPENVNFGIKASTVKQFLNSSGLPTKWAERNKKMSDKDISQIASKQTVMVVCHRE